MRNSGKLLTIGLLAVALAAASFAWWFQFARGRRALAYWGGADATTIRHGEESELLAIAPWNDAPSPLPDDALTLDGQAYRVTGRASLNAARGMVHARHALIDDASYDWNDPPPEQPVWTHLLLFHDASRESVGVLVSLDSGYLKRRGGGRALRMSATLRDGLSDYFAEHLTSETPPSRAPPR